MIVTYAHYITFKQKNGTPIDGMSFQNYFIGETRNFNGKPYRFGPFNFSGTMSGKGSEASQAAIVMLKDPISVSLSAQAARGRWLVSVSFVAISLTSEVPQSNQAAIVSVDGVTFEETAILATQIWKCSQMTSDSEKITIPLMNALDATRGNAPSRVLTETMVGSLPPTGAIFGI